VRAGCAAAHAGERNVPSTGASSSRGIVAALRNGARLHRLGGGGTQPSATPELVASKINEKVKGYAAGRRPTTLSASRRRGPGTARLPSVPRVAERPFRHRLVKGGGDSALKLTESGVEVGSRWA
jgi:hypothetical protein